MSTRHSTVVGEIVAHHLCCGCGTCVAVCPTAALSMRETPAGFLVAEMADENACIGCGRCLKACPGAMLADEHEKPFEGLSDPVVGEIRDAYWGWARSDATRLGGVSGGVVTALVRGLMTSGEVEAALVTRWSPDDPLAHQAYIAREPDDLLPSQKSRYCPVALNTELRQLMAFDRVAVVGLPCHLQGIEHATRLLGTDFPETIRIGLFCDRTLSKLLIERLIDVAGVSRPVRRFQYRHKGAGGWPGDVCVGGAEDKRVFLDADQRMRRKDPYTSVRCRVCFDKLNVLADISCGDGYGAPYAEEGVSAVLIRTERGQRAIDAAGDALQLERIPQERVLRDHHPRRRRQQCQEYWDALAELRPDAPRVLPRSCAGTSERRHVDRCLSQLSRAMQFETAPDRQEAVRIARDEERRQSIRMLPRRARSRVTGAIKWCLARLPGGEKLITRLRAAGRSDAPT